MASTTTSGKRPLTAGPDSGPQPPFPLHLSGKVIKGFGRGSSELGIPTANIPIEGLSVGGHEDVESGVYFGWAGLSASPATRSASAESQAKYQLMSSDVATELQQAISRSSGGGGNVSSDDSAENRGAVYPMVMSIGWNPFYKNTVRSVEVHIMHHFERQFYDSHMNLAILGFIRPELDYVSKEKLIEDIRTDIDVAGRSLAREPYVKLRNEPELVTFSGKDDVAR